MSQELIILFSMLMATVIVVGYNELKRIKKQKNVVNVFNRFNYLKEVERSGNFKREVIYFEEEFDNNTTCVKNKKSKRNKVRINGKEYTDKDAWFIMDGRTLYIIGKEKEFIVELHSKLLDEFEGGN